MKIKKNILYVFFVLIYLLLLKLLELAENSDSQANIRNIFDAFWYSIVTLTTVGYGDFYPVTTTGKILGLTIILASLGLLGYLIGNVTNLIREYMEKKKEGFYGTSFVCHFVVIGWDTFARQVVDQIVHARDEVAIVTNNKEDIDLIKELYVDDKVFVMFTDYNNYDAYEKVNMHKSKAVFINLQDDTENLVFIINIKKHFPDCEYVVSLNKPDLKDTYRTIGVDKVISRNEIASKIVASYIFEPDVGRFTEDLIATSVDETDHDIQQYLVTDSNPFVDSDYLNAFINLKKEYDCILLGISRMVDGRQILMKNPSAGTVIKKGDYMVLISNGISKKEIEDSFGVKEGLLMISERE